MFKDDILLKEKNQISVNTLFENISFIEILKLFKGVYELKAEKKSVEGISQFNKCFIEILKEIIPELKVNPLLNKRDQFNSKILISFGNKSYYYRLPYYSYFINPKYDKNGMKIFDKNIHLDFDGFYHNELINILRQIGADFNLGLVFEHINSASLFNSGYLDKNVEIFEGQLLLCVDKKIARDFGNMMIPITVDEYDELRDYRSSHTYLSTFAENSTHLFFLTSDNGNERLVSIYDKRSKKLLQVSGIQCDTDFIFDFIAGIHAYEDYFIAMILPQSLSRPACPSIPRRSCRPCRKGRPFWRGSTSF